MTTKWVGVFKKFSSNDSALFWCLFLFHSWSFFIIRLYHTSFKLNIPNVPKALPTGLAVLPRYPVAFYFPIHAKSSIFSFLANTLPIDYHMVRNLIGTSLQTFTILNHMASSQQPPRNLPIKESTSENAWQANMYHSN